MDGSTEYNAKRKKSEKENYHMISLICGISETKHRSKGEKKRAKQIKKQTLNGREQTYGYQRKGMGDELNR